MNDPLANLTSRLLAHRVLPRTDPLARRALTDERFRQELDERLAAVGLTLLENPYAEHITVALLPKQESAVFGHGDVWLSNNQGLPRDAVALLVVLWALIVLPKRQRQHTRRHKEAADQADLFGAEKPMPTGEEVSSGVSEDALVADFGRLLGGKSRLAMNLGLLARLGFVRRHNRQILEGPLLDLVLDYSKLAPRIIDGALGDVIRQAGVELPSEVPGSANADDEDEDTREEDA